MAFNADYYLQNNADVADAASRSGMALGDFARQHYENHGRNENRSAFDGGSGWRGTNWYEAPAAQTPAPAPSYSQPQTQNFTQPTGSLGSYAQAPDRQAQMRQRWDAGDTNVLHDYSMADLQQFTGFSAADITAAQGRYAYKPATAAPKPGSSAAPAANSAAAAPQMVDTTGRGHYEANYGATPESRAYWNAELARFAQANGLGNLSFDGANAYMLRSQVQDANGTGGRNPVEMMASFLSLPYLGADPNAIRPAVATQGGAGVGGMSAQQAAMNNFGAQNYRANLQPGGPGYLGAYVPPAPPPTAAPVPAPAGASAGAGAVPMPKPGPAGPIPMPKPGSGVGGASSTVGQSGVPGVTGTATSSSSSGLQDPSRWNIDFDSTVQGRLQNLMAKDSPLMEQARSRAMQKANASGLLNSSMAATAGESAMLDAGLDIAKADATMFGRAGEFNATQGTAFARDANNFGRELQMGAVKQGYAMEQARFAREMEDKKLAADIDYRNAQLGMDRDKIDAGKEENRLQRRAAANKHISDTIATTNANIAQIESNKDMSKDAKSAAIRNLANDSQIGLDAYAYDEGLTAPNAWPDLTGRPRGGAPAPGATGTAGAPGAAGRSPAGGRGGATGPSTTPTQPPPAYTRSPEGNSQYNEEHATYWLQGADTEGMKTVVKYLDEGVTGDRWMEDFGSDEPYTYVGQNGERNAAGPNPYPGMTRDQVARMRMAELVDQYMAWNQQRGVNEKSPFLGGNLQNFISWGIGRFDRPGDAGFDLGGDGGDGGASAA